MCYKIILLFDSWEDLKDVKHRWKYLLLKTLVSYTSNRIGHVITYDLILPNQ